MSRRTALLLASVAAVACSEPEPTLGLEWPAPSSGTPLRDSLGVSINQWFSGEQPTPMMRARTLDLIEATGMRWIRQDLRWTNIEPTRGELLLDGYSAWLDEASARGFQVMAMLGYGNPWAAARAAGNDVVPPDDPADFARFAGAVARTLGDRISMFEVWNEPNAGRFWRIPSEATVPNLSGDPVAFAELLAQAASAIHAERPGTPVLFGGVFFAAQAIIGGDEFIDRALSARPALATLLDGYAFHPYALYPPRAGPEDSGEGETPFVQMAAHLDGVLRSHGAVERLAVSGIGWPTFPSPEYDQLDPRTQAAYLVRSALLAVAHGATPWIVFTLEDGPHTDEFPPEDNFGLYFYDADPSDNAPPVPKPAFEAIRTLAVRYGDFAYARDRTAELSLGEGAWALELTAADGRVLTVLSRTKTSRAQHAIAVPLHRGALVTVHDALGAPVEHDVLPNGEVRVPVDPWPTFVLEAPPSPAR